MKPEPTLDAILLFMLIAGTICIIVGGISLLVLNLSN